MKFKTVIDKNVEEEVVIHAHERNAFVNDIENMCLMDSTTIIGVKNEKTFILNPLDISFFESQNNNVFAYVKDEQYKVKNKLYQLDELLPDTFVKINKSKLANIKRIKCFSSSIGGSIMVTFDNGHQDYISRRELKNVKERLGL